MALPGADYAKNPPYWLEKALLRHFRPGNPGRLLTSRPPFFYGFFCTPRTEQPAQNTAPAVVSAALGHAARWGWIIYHRPIFPAPKWR